MDMKSRSKVLYIFLVSIFYLICMLIPIFCLIFFITEGTCLNRVNLGLTGHWNNDFGSLNAVKVVEVVEEEEYYAYCTSSKGLVIFNIKKDSANQSVEASLKSFIPLGNCQDIMIIEDEDNEGDIYICITCGDAGLSIIKMNNHRFQYCMATCMTLGSAHGIAIAGDFAYVADGEDGLVIIDMRNKKIPVITGYCNIPGFASGVAIAGEYAYVASGYNGLQIINISNPKNPRLVASCDTPEFARNVTIKGDYAYVANERSGLVIVDIGDANRPGIVGGCDTPWSAQNVTIKEADAEDYAYIADGGSGLVVVDIGDANRPEIVGSCDTPGFASDIAPAGRHLCIADGDKGLQVIDITSQKGPVIRGNCNTPGIACGIAIADDYIYLADGDKGLQVIDISNKNRPEIIGGCKIQYNIFPYNIFPLDVTINDVVTKGDYAYVTEGDEIEIGLRVIDISDKKNPKPVGACHLPGYPQRMGITGDYIYVVGGGLQIIDISTRDLPEVVGSCDTPGGGFDVAVAGDYAYIADGWQGLSIVDISDTNNPEFVGSYDVTFATGVAVAGDHAFVTILDSNGNSSLQVIYINDPNQPKIAGSCGPIGSAYYLAIAGNYAFVAGGFQGLFVIDISDANRPEIVGSCETPDSAYDIAVAGEYAYIADTGMGLQVIDVSNKKGPIIRESYTIRGFAYDVSVTDNCAYVANDDMGLLIIDIINENGAQIIRGCDIFDSARNVSISGNYAYLADYYKGLRILDLSTSGGQEITGYCQIPDIANDIAIDGKYAYVTDSGGLHVIEIKDNESPEIVATWKDPWNPRGLAIAEDYAYVVDYDRGLQVVDISDPDLPERIGSCPTPGKASGIKIKGNHAYVADGASGLQIIDITEKRWPKIVGSLDTPGYAKVVAIVKDYAFMVGDGENVLVIDIKDPKSPTIVSSYDTYGSVSNFFTDGDYLYIAAGTDGLLKLNVDIGPQPKSSLILVAGGNMDYKDLYWQSIQLLANKIYNGFRNQGLEVYDIYYMNSFFFQGIDNGGFPDQLMVDDLTPTKEGEAEGFNYAVTNWAAEEDLNTGPLYIYLIGHGAEDLFQIMPNEILKAQELKGYINRFKTNSLANPIDPNQTSPRPVVLILESAASGSFIDDLADPNDTYQNTFIITSTGNGPSYIKPSYDPNNPVPISFTSSLMRKMQNYSLEDLYLLQETFIDAREELYYTPGLPFLDQAPQMYIPGGPITLTLEDPNRPYDPNNPEALLIINQEDPITLIIKARYTDGNTITLNPHHLIFLSSRPQVFNPSDPNQLEKDPNNKNHILIHPARTRNGLCTLIAYPDPDYYPDIFLTARLPIEVSITGNTIAGGDKALIVAGYYAKEGIPDYLWESTNIIANHAYLSLRKKRYSHDDIFYLNPLYKQDVDQNGKYDDIDGYPRIEKIDWAINEIEQTGAEELLIFLVDHGYQEAFNLNPKVEKEKLTAQYLKERIISLAPSSKEEKSVQKTITLLIDACHSGSFIPALQNNLQPQADPNQLIIITSTDPNENAQFFGDGLISFSYPFFDEYLLTNSFLNAFRHAYSFISPIGQTPQISDPDLVRKRDKALEYYIDEARPLITERALSREGEKLTITARVYSLSGIERVWFVITSCEGPIPAQEGGPRTEEPTDLMPKELNAPYGGIYTIEIIDPYPNAFNYQVILFAKDKTGKVITERTNINNQERNTTGAIILVTDHSAAPYISQAIYDQSHNTYLILKQRQIRDDDIHNDIYYVKTPVDYPGERIDKTPESFDMEAISTWLQERSYQALLIYLIGESGYNAQGEVYFKLCQNHHIYPSDLAAHIHTQEGCQVLLFCEMTDAQGFLNHFPLKPTWAAIASPYIKIDTPLFSNHFFSNISSFDTVGEAFEKAYRAFRRGGKPSDYIYFYDFVPSGLVEICEKLGYHLGDPEIPGEDPMLIKDTQVIEGTSTLTLRLKVNESARIKTPWAELRTPSGYISRNLLEQRDANICLWESPPLPKDKSYTRVSFYVEQVQDANQPGIIDWRERAITSFSQGTGETPHEPNDTQEYAYPIVIDIPQKHTFHDTNDADWVYFYAYKGEVYYIEANDPIYGYFTKITLCDANGIMIHQEGFYNPFFIDQSWHFSQNGYYTLRVESAAAPEDIPFSYDLSITKAPAPIPTADIQGRVVDQNHDGINGLDVYIQTGKGTLRKTSTGSIKNVRRPAAYQTMNPEIKTEGWFFMENLLAPGSYKIRVTAKDDPNTILAEPSIHLYENNIHLIDDIVIMQDLLPSQKDPNKEAIEGFERAYTRWQQILGRQYLPWEDTDNDEFTNLREFLNMTDPSDRNHPTLAYNLYPGLNLFPFHLYDTYYWAEEFCFQILEEYHSIWGYNKKENVWDYWYKDSGGTDFLLEKGKGYLIYKHSPEVIYHEAHNSISFLTPGINLVGISPIPEGSPYKSYTSFQFLMDRKKEGVKSISRYRNDQEGEHKSKDIRETSYLFFGRPAGVEFPILPNEAYLIKVNKE